MNAHSFVKLSLVEYVFVSLCLAVIIAKFFPAIHNQIVSTVVNSLEYQSLYWGSAVVTNVFTYGLVFLFARGLSLNMQYLLYFPTYNIMPLYKRDQFSYESLCIVSTQEFVILYYGSHRDQRYPAPSICTLRKLIMVYEYACHGVWSYTTLEGVWLSQQIHCKHCSLWLP